MRALQHLITALLFVHGAIHLLGWLEWAHIGHVPQLSGRTLVPLAGLAERTFAGLWATAFLLLTLAAILRLARHDVWWAPALTGIALSQGLVIVSWPDAKFGTVLNVLLLLPALAGAAQVRFSHRIDQEVRSVLAASPPGAERGAVQQSDLADLPAPVRSWLEQSGIVGHAPIQNVRLRQRGELRTAPGAAWMPATAEQYFTVEPPAFVWRVETTMFGFLPVAGRDILAQGRGEMLIKAASLLNVVHAADDKIDHGAKLRFLGEMVWFPAGALAPYVSWQAIDPGSARATMNAGATPVSAVFHFDEQGRVVALEAQRYLGGGPTSKLTPWSVTCSEWSRFEGIELPVRGEVRWILPEGAFAYYRWQVLDVEFNRSDLFGASSTSASPRAAVPSGPVARRDTRLRTGRRVLADQDAH